MGIDTALLDRIVKIGERENLLSNRSALVLGDCNFYTSWSSGNNRRDLSYFRQLLGLASAETVDIAGGPSIRLDLQGSVPAELVGQFDLIIDAGTLFCCFDIAAVLENCLTMLKDRGAMIHVCGLTGYFGRSYYNIHPKLFGDFYTQNGFEMLAMDVRIHKQNSLLANLQRRWSEWRGRSVGHFVPVAKDAFFLKDADFVSMQFTSEIAAEAPMLPNDALLLFAAKREKRGAFVSPIP